MLMYVKPPKTKTPEVFRAPPQGHGGLLEGIGPTQSELSIVSIGQQLCKNLFTKKG